MNRILKNLFLWYLRTLARIQLKKTNPIIIGIGGASGKTSLTHLTALILSQKYRVKQSKGKNSETGIPLNILGLEVKSYNFVNWLKITILAPLKIIFNWEKLDVYVVEMGIDSPYPPKNMSYLLSFIKPKISVLTNIYIEHSQYFDSLSKKDNVKDRKNELISEIAEQEKLLITTLGEKDRAIINLDDPIIRNLLPISLKTLTVSASDKGADFYISRIQNSENEFKVNFTFLKETYELNIKQPLPRYFAHEFIFAIAIAFSNEINIKDSINFIEKNFSLPPGRFTRFKGIKDTTIFDSSYNSSLEAAVGALETISEIGKSKRKVGILGDMRELGSLSRIQHELLAKEILKNLDFVVLIGPLMNEFVVPVLEKEKFSFKAFNSFKEAKDNVLSLVKSRDLILVKGSQNTLFLERVVEKLLFNSKDSEKLARRGRYWDRVRRLSG